MLDDGVLGYYIWLWIHRHRKYLWSLCKTVQIFELKNCNSFRLHMAEGSQQIILLKSVGDAGLKQINIIAETFQIYFHLISMFSSLFSICGKQEGEVIWWNGGRLIIKMSYSPLNSSQYMWQHSYQGLLQLNPEKYQVLQKNRETKSPRKPTKQKKQLQFLLSIRL